MAERARNVHGPWFLREELLQVAFVEELERVEERAPHGFRVIMFGSTTCEKGFLGDACSSHMKATFCGIARDKSCQGASQKKVAPGLHLSPFPFSDLETEPPLLLAAAKSTKLKAKNNRPTMKDVGKPLSFFKFFMAEHSSKRMRIPPAVVDYIKHQRPPAIALTGPGGDSWMVDLIKEEGALYFGGGWPKFVEDHSVQTGDFLVFQYDGEAGFKVRLFDPTMSPREASFHARNSHRVSTEAIKSNGVIPIKPERDMDGACGSSGTARISFQITLKASQIKLALFPIPREFCDQHIGEQEDRVNITLCDGGGKQWPVSMIRRKDLIRRRGWYLSKGLRAFIRDNLVEEGDTCAFELVSPSLLRVRISRAQEEGTN